MEKDNLTYLEIYDRYKNLVFRVAYDYSGDYDAAEDITQDTFLKLNSYFDSIHQTNLKAWLFTTAKHAALNYRRRSHREVPEETVRDTLSGNVHGGGESAEEKILEAEQRREELLLHEKIMTSLLEKNKRWYEAIMAVYVLEVPQGTVAEKMGVSLNVLYSMLHRAKEWIRKEYGVEYQELKDG
jgi:RNA polymerase sigma factor (sigma-70 family)